MKNKIIALTGGIGSGKSTALEILENAGYKTLSSDKIVSELYKKRAVKKMLKSLFPTAVSGFINLKIDRKKISQIVFNDSVMHKKLTDVITPLVLKEILLRAKKMDAPVFAEVPLLFECGYENNFDEVLVITRPLSDRIKSVKKRSSLTEEEIRARIKKQTDYENKDLKDYHLVVNDGDLNSLKEKVLSTVSNLLSVE